MARTATVGLAAVVVGACLACTGGGGEASPEAVVGVAAPPPEAPAPASPAPTWKLTAVQAGDASCYLEVTGADGGAQTLQADFELCPGGSRDASRWVGRQLTTTTRPSEVMAPSCAGNPECADHVTVDLVVDVAVVGGADAAPAGSCPVDVLEKALADSDMASAVRTPDLRDPKCTAAWATARTVSVSEEDTITVLFSLGEGGAWVATEAALHGVCAQVPEAEQAHLDCR